jgi:hypothetical protein
MAGDVRRSGGQWRATGGAPAGGSTPPGADHLPRTARMSSRRRRAATEGRSSASACAPDAGTTRTAACRRGCARRRGRARLGVPGRLQFAGAVFKLKFLWISKLKCTLKYIAKLKIKDPSSTFAKAGRVFIQRIEREQHAKLAKISAPINRKPAP